MSPTRFSRELKEKWFECGIGITRNIRVGTIAWDWFRVVKRSPELRKPLPYVNLSPSPWRNIRKAFLSTPYVVFIF